MNHFLQTIASNLPIGQRQTLLRFLEDVKSGRVAADATSIERALDEAGQLIEVPEVDPTEPGGYNAVVRTLIANLAGLYQEIDKQEAVQDALGELNTTELDRIELGLRDLGTVLESVKQANRTNVEYSDVYVETFASDLNRENGREWYQPLPVLALSGQVESFLPLEIDPDDRSLKLLRGGDFSRSTNAQGEPLAHVEVEEILGLSADRSHAISQAVDGKFYTYWRELILTGAPIEADSRQVPWLPPTYTGGAACRVHFRFPFAVPFTEVIFRPFSRFPVRVSQVVWNNRKVAVAELVRDGTFTSGSLFWSSGAVSGSIVSFPEGVGFDASRAAKIVSPGGRTILTSSTFMLSGAEFAYQLTYRLKRTRDIEPSVLINWYDTGSNLVRSDWLEPQIHRDEWSEYSKLVIAPSGAASGYTSNLVLVADGSGTIFYDGVSFSRTAGALNTDAQIELESDSLSVSLDSASATDLWLVMDQPHYEFLQVAIPEGELDALAQWEEIRLAAESKADTVLGTPTTFWTLKSGRPDTSNDELPVDGSTLVREVSRLGGRLRELLVKLTRFTRPSPATRSFSRYLYVLGAWEIQIRHREYSSQGLYVTRPFHPRGEVREAILQTNPTLANLDPRIHFWLTARAEDRSNRAQPFTGRATFSSSTEVATRQAPTHFTLTPVTLQETHEGTDRLGRVTLKQAPYVDRTRVWNLQATLSSGTISQALAYDPNQETIHQIVSGSIHSLSGYRPIKVNLAFADGTMARPDIAGNLQAGDITFAGPELLTEATVEQTRSFETQSGPFGFIGLADQTRQQIDSRQRTQTASQTALQTRFGKITGDKAGLAFSLYWHKRGDDTPAGIVTSGDVLIPTAKYTVDPETGLVVVKDSAPNGNAAYNSFIAYYYHQQTEAGARQAFESRDTVPTSGVDFTGGLTQSYPVTRNMTNYVRGDVRRLRRTNLDDLDPDFYPVYEYLVDGRGRLIFAELLGPGSDRPARITVEYESLLIEPRLLVEYRTAGLNELSSKSPQLLDLSLFFQSKR